MCGKIPILVGDSFQWVFAVKKLNKCTLSSLKFLNFPFFTITLHKYCSAFLMTESVSTGDFPNEDRNWIGFASIALFLLPILLVISHPVKLCTAGKTERNSPSFSNRKCVDMYRVVSPTPHLTHNSTKPFCKKIFMW